MRRLFPIVVALLLSIQPDARAADLPACGEVSCGSGIIFRVPAAQFSAPGRYDVQVAIDRKTVSCSGELPLKPCDQGASFTCTTRQVGVTETGCAGPEDAGRITEIAVAGAPSKIVLRIARDGKTLLTRTLQPQYQMSQPNGPACPPTCYNAVYDLSDLR